MITKDNIKKLLSILKFKQEGNIYTKLYEGIRTPLKVDIKNERFHYNEIGITVGRETTSNFSEPENFVVFECIDRLLYMGYKPEHIELEPAWKLGHTQKGGYADIWVRTYNGLSGEMATDKESLLIIECKSLMNLMVLGKILLRMVRSCLVTSNKNKQQSSFVFIHRISLEKKRNQCITL